MTKVGQSYKDTLSARLVQHKHNSLHVQGSGKWNYRGELIEYGHILPPGLDELNLLPGYRKEIWQYVHSDVAAIKLHQYFHHLNSSQAMCLNLFYPFIADNYALMPILQQILDLPDESVVAVFEKVFTKGFYEGENTNFDFYLESTGRPRAFFELKLSEADFGKATKRKEDTVEEYRDKYAGKRERYHRGTLTQLIDVKWLEFDAFTKNYQLLRNISYLGRYTDAHLFVIFPKKNESLRRGAKILGEIIKPKLSDRVTIFYLEDLLNAILSGPAMKHSKTAEHFLEFKDKYIVQ